MSSSGSGLNLEKYLIPLAEINRATENFIPQRCIGGGGFGKVYRGQLSKRWQNRKVAIKRLDQTSYQGENEFRNELKMISSFHHKNIISFIGYCDEGSEMIIVYEYAANGSLDHHFEDPSKRRRITWIQRLKICRGAARGLDYLHSGLGEHNRVIHRDMKSANILLDENLVAKVCDFGLSRFGPRNQQDTQVYTKVAGTQYYLDPTYHESSILQKESDVYSFGVVLFEMLSGMLVYRKQTFANEKMPQSIINFVRRYYHKKLDKLIDPDIKDQVDSRSFEVFKEIAYKCISLNLMERPTMETLIEKIEVALNIELQNNDAAFIEYVMEEIRFSHGKPVVAFTIYKRLLRKKYFEAESTTAFDRLIQFFNSAIEVKKDNTHMAYWLSNASALLFLIQKSLKLDGASSDVVQQVKAAKKPGLDFMQELKEYVEKVYGIIFSNLKKDVESILALCIQDLKNGRLQRRSSYWKDILDLLYTFLNIFKEIFVPIIIAQKIFTQIFSYINVQLFNSLLQHRTCCSSNNLRNLIDGLLLFNMWCHKATPEYAGSALDELQHIDQATQFLIFAETPMVNYDEIRLVIPRIVSKSQLTELCTNVYNEDNRHLNEGFKECHARLKREMKVERSDASKQSLLIKENSSICFSGEDLSNSLQVEDFKNVEPAHVQLSEYQAFDFLYN